MVNLRTFSGYGLRITNSYGEQVYARNTDPETFSFARGFSADTEPQGDNIPVMFGGDSVYVRELHPGEELTAVFVTTFPDLGNTWYYELVNWFIHTDLESSNITIPINVSPEWVDRPSLPSGIAASIWQNISNFFTDTFLDVSSDVAGSTLMRMFQGLNAIGSLGVIHFSICQVI